jgi:hypothetical protein
MLYKFLDSRDVDRVMVEGTIMVSSLQYFRDLETTAGDIGDPLEGGSEVTIRDAITVTEGSPELAMLNAADIGLGAFTQFAKIEGGGQINIGAGMRFVHLVPNVYIYSFSEGDLALLTNEMCVNAPLPYDACLMIKNRTELGRACFVEGIIKNLGDRRVREVFEQLVLRPVEYLPRSIDVTEGKAMAPDPFKKGERFRPQSEERLVFVPRDSESIAEQRLIVAIPDPAALFEVVFRDRPKP